MPSIDLSTRKKIHEYVKSCAGEGKMWENNADSICHLIENGKIISGKDIVYSDDGAITKIKGTEVRDGVLLLKEKKQPLKATIVKNTDPIPFIEGLRNARRNRRVVAI